jgi:hypothetical protein
LKPIINIQRIEGCVFRQKTIRKLEKETKLLTYDTEQLQIICGARSSSRESDDAKQPPAEPRLAAAVNRSYDGRLAGTMGSVDQYRTVTSSGANSLISGNHESLDSLKSVGASPIDRLLTAQVLLAQCQVAQSLLVHLL